MAQIARLPIPHEEQRADYTSFIARLTAKGAKLLGQGCSRQGYRLKNYVFKVPAGGYLSGIQDNIIEYTTYLEWKKTGKVRSSQYAPPKDMQLGHCRLLSNYVLVMEYLGKLDGNPMPEWVKGMCDGYQAGMNRKGQVRAWDYAHFNHRHNAHEFLK